MALTKSAEQFSTQPRPAEPAVHEPFSIRGHSTRCCYVMELAGALNMATAPQVTHHLESDLVVPDHLIVDLTGLTFMDSTGLMVLLSASDEVEGRISVVGPTPPVQKVLDLSGTSVLFHVAPDRATAATYLHTAS